VADRKVEQGGFDLLSKYAPETTQITKPSRLTAPSGFDIMSEYRPEEYEPTLGERFYEKEIKQFVETPKYLGRSLDIGMKRLITAGINIPSAIGRKASEDISKALEIEDIAYKYAPEDYEAKRSETSDKIARMIKDIIDTEVATIESVRKDPLLTDLKKEEMEMVMATQKMSWYDPRKLVFTGGQAVPQIVASMLAGAATGGLLPLAQMGAAGTRISQMVPFGVLAGGGYMEEAEASGATLDEQIAYGTTMGMVEAATEAPFFGILGKLIGGTGINRGIFSLAKKVGINRLALFGTGLVTEAVQEAAAEAAAGISSKFIYDKEKGWFGPEGAIDPARIA